MKNTPNTTVIQLVISGFVDSREVQDALDFNNDCKDPSDPVTQMIIKGYGCETYDELKQLLNPYGLVGTTILYAPKYSTIPQDSLIDYGKNAPPGTIAAWIDHWFEYTKPDIEKNPVLEWLPYIALIIVIAISGYILAQAVQLAGKAH